MTSFRALAARHRTLLIFALVLVAGYSVGKDMALRDNAADRAAAAGTN